MKILLIAMLAVVSGPGHAAPVVAKSSAKKGRAHHIRYAQEELRREFFGDPKKMLKTLKEPMGETFLFYVWQQMGKKLSSPLKHADIGSMPGSKKKQVITLSIVGVDQKDGYTWAVIQMPPTFHPGESVYILMLQRPGKDRYFTVDRTGDTKKGKLTEWRSDGSRHDRGSTTFDVEDVLEAVSSVLGKQVK